MLYEQDSREGYLLALGTLAEPRLLEVVGDIEGYGLEYGWPPRVTPSVIPGGSACRRPTVA
ncbi:MAG: hypothetical protein IPJ34_15505 [Myxococcales bacterium]|nr:hypothetical protein [Myxococcales bacterium]